MMLASSNLKIPARVWIGVALLIVFSVRSNVHLLWRSLTNGIDFSGNDQISRYEKCYEEIKPMLPSHGVVGYVGDERRGGSEKGISFLLTQYSLVPTIVLRSTLVELVVVDLRDDLEADPPLEQDCWILLKDCHSGVKLYRRKAP